ncbi:hypothetical protein L1887_09562 [Cichorium endivia]|nr:hypothetical protein L1887_09562 [Cichorium endivia]
MLELEYRIWFFKKIVGIICSIKILCNLRDRVFGPTTTTRHVYDIAAQDVVSGAIEGINGTIFAYGVTSSGKTHTMHGDQRSPGIIPLAINDAFSIIQETPDGEFLLCVSYLEIYNEVVNDLLHPTGQNLRIRDNSQGAFVEGIKEEVVLSLAHALSLILAGEEHRHVGSTHFNLLSSRSHTIFTLTIESSPCGENTEGEAVNFSQLGIHSRRKRRISGLSNGTLDFIRDLKYLNFLKLRNNGISGSIPSDIGDYVNLKQLNGHLETLFNPKKKALLYKLSGYYNPLHADPNIAEVAGALMMGLMFHGKAKKLVKNRKYEDAVEVLAMGEIWRTPLNGAECLEANIVDIGSQPKDIIL